MTDLQTPSTYSSIPRLKEPNDHSQTNFAFLLHSQGAPSNISQSSGDNQPFARQKRRRTSPKDHAVLEEEYLLNSRPDKARRLEIVKRVALGEKEVQIWFQNRRQLTRRKSGPAPPQGTDPDARTGMDDKDAMPDTSEPRPDGFQVLESSSQASLQPDQGPRIDLLDMGVSHRKSGSSRGAATSAKAQQRDGVCQTFKMDSTGIMRPREPADMFKSSSPGPRHTGYVANRRSAPFSIHEDSGSSQGSQISGPSNAESEPANTWSPRKHTRSLKRASSLVKLATDEEGNAEVTARTGETPSPPRPGTPFLSAICPQRESGLRRSLSAVETGNMKLVATGISNHIVRRKSLGRSRDSRTWEFYCDTSAREELNKQAEREQTGSAAAAIGLMRSHSNNAKILTPNANKRNAKTNTMTSSKKLKGSSSQKDRPKLERATSSFARMETMGSSSPKHRPNKVLDRPKKSTPKTAIFESYDEGDSDKENWAPGTQTRPAPRRRPVTNQESARILLESLQEPSGSSSERDARIRDSSTRRSPISNPFDKENARPAAGDVIAVLMDDDTATGQEDDLDCVQNLLSLSQATWV